MARWSPRTQLRTMLLGGHSMETVDSYAASGFIGERARDRFARLWAVGTATEHPYTAAWSLDRWRARRERVQCATRLARGV